MYGWRMALWGAGIAAFGVAMVLFFRADDDSPMLPFVLCVVMTFACVPAAEIYATERKRREKRESFIQKFGSVDELRQAVDGPGLRRMRDEDGLLSAVREIRRQYPGMPIDMATTLVKES